MQLMSRLCRFGSLPAATQWRLLVALAGLTLVAVGLQLIGFRRMVAFLQRWIPPPHQVVLTELETSVRIRRIGYAVRWAVSHCPLATLCLARSLTLWWLLRSAGIKGVLCIGVSKPEGQFKSHAWVEFEGVALNDNTDVRKRYTAFETAWWEQADR